MRPVIPWPRTAALVYDAIFPLLAILRLSASLTPAAPGNRVGFVTIPARTVARGRHASTPPADRATRSGQRDVSSSVTRPENARMGMGALMSKSLLATEEVVSRQGSVHHVSGDPSRSPKNLARPRPVAAAKPPVGCGGVTSPRSLRRGWPDMCRRSCEGLRWAPTIRESADGWSTGESTCNELRRFWRFG
jgi:hypothetical protein